MWSLLHGAGDRLRDVVMGANADGRLEVFGTAGDDTIWHTWQTSPSNGWSAWTQFHSAGDRLRTLAVGRNADGRLEVFGTAGDDTIWHTWQTSPSNGWSA
ncbi:MAG: peptidoglycan-binding protein, partial [Dermatophilaceae bacterium]